MQVFVLGKPLQPSLTFASEVPEKPGTNTPAYLMRASATKKKFYRVACREYYKGGSITVPLTSCLTGLD